MSIPFKSIKCRENIHLLTVGLGPFCGWWSPLSEHVESLTFTRLLTMKIINYLKMHFWGCQKMSLFCMKISQQKRLSNSCRAWVTSWPASCNLKPATCNLLLFSVCFHTCHPPIHPCSSFIPWGGEVKDPVSNIIISVSSILLVGLASDLLPSILPSITTA